MINIVVPPVSGRGSSSVWTVVGRGSGGGGSAGRGVGDEDFL